MNRPRVTLPLRLPLVLALAGAAAAQTPEPVALEPVPGVGLVRGLHGIAFEDGGVVAGGPDWKARIEAGEVRFTPALGTAVAENQTLSFRLLDVRRGEALVAAAAAEPVVTLAQDQVELQHASGVLERYRASPEGLHQSFVIPTRPAGTGDLVVSGRVSTVLPPGEPTEDGGVAFLLPGIGGVRIGPVTGVDAAGRTAPGSLRLDGDRLELVLPAAFVDRAAYPLVVDPLMGSVISIAAGSNDDWDPDVASNLPLTLISTTYLVVWRRVFSIGDSDVRGMRLGIGGTPLGSLLLIETSDAPVLDPKVAYVRFAGRYLVVWQEQPGLFSPFQIRGRAVTALDAVMSGTVTIASSTSHERSPEIAGDRTLADNDALVVWRRDGTGIMGRQVTVTAGDPSPLGLVTIADDFGTDSYRNPAISKSGGDTGIYLVAWENGPIDVLYRLVDRNLNLIGGAYLLGASLGGPHRRPACAGNGQTFMLVWERGESGAFASSDVYGLSLSHASGTTVHNTFGPIEADPGDIETEPDVVSNGKQFVVAYLDRDGSAVNTYAKTVDPYTCLVCEPETLVATPADDRSPALASRYAGGSSGENAFLVWGNGTPATDGDVYGQLFASPHGQTDEGGGCGAGGVAETPCPFAGNPNFTLHLRQAAPATPAVLLISPQLAPFGCGPCTIVPNLAVPHVFAAGPTDSAGSAEVAIPLPPSASGVTFWNQWGVLTGGPCPALGIALSNGVRTTVQL